jgi:hypothetical protein
MKNFAVCHFNSFIRIDGDESIQEKVKHVSAEFAVTTFTIKDGLLPKFAHALVRPIFEEGDA